jgi:uncharacterized small protein (DUF1192 family)
MDDDAPRKKITHEIGQDLYLISADELAERIALLKAEISRLEADMDKKRSSRSVADQLFKR